jgi:hypothetical protein
VGEGHAVRDDTGKDKRGPLGVKCKGGDLIARVIGHQDAVRLALAGDKHALLRHRKIFPFQFGNGTGFDDAIGRIEAMHPASRQAGGPIPTACALGARATTAKRPSSENAKALGLSGA